MQSLNLGRFPLRNPQGLPTYCYKEWNFSKSAHARSPPPLPPLKSRAHRAHVLSERMNSTGLCATSTGLLYGFTRRVDVNDPRNVALGHEMHRWTGHMPSGRIRITRRTCCVATESVIFNVVAMEHSGAAQPHSWHFGMLEKEHPSQGWDGVIIPSVLGVEPCPGKATIGGFMIGQLSFRWRRAAMGVQGLHGEAIGPSPIVSASCENRGLGATERMANDRHTSSAVSSTEVWAESLLPLWRCQQVIHLRRKAPVHTFESAHVDGAAIKVVDDVEGAVGSAESNHTLVVLVEDRKLVMLPKPCGGQ
mmetsp:Transcript_126770/g.282573  ORF Transcript_126770/g.282573 Transcript_126770/m.282573 type:complete len:306 (-) Transcript_126770:283-1200(-)